MADLGAIGNYGQGYAQAHVFPLYAVDTPQMALRQDGAWQGTVRDPSGAYMEGVKLTLHWLPSGRLIGTTWTDRAGAYRFNGLDLLTQSYFVVCHDKRASPDYQYLIRSFVN